MSQPQAPAVFALGLGEIANSRKRDQRGNPPADEMQQWRDRGSSETQQCERLEKRNHPSRALRAVTRRSTKPKGVSVVTWWYEMPPR